MTGIGPPPAKQLKNAILDEDEEKAISIYTAVDGDTSLLDQLHPSKPFPSKKNQVSETPLHLSAAFALIKLFSMLLEHGGDPSTMNTRNETCLHKLCSMRSNPETRAALMDMITQWRGLEEDSDQPTYVSLNQIDLDGNAAIHYAAANGLVACVQKLVQLGAIISIVNKEQLTCCEIADQAGYKKLALMLEIALVFQPEDEGMAGFEDVNLFPYEGRPAKLFLDGQALSLSGVHNFVEDAVSLAAKAMGGEELFRSRAECLLNAFAWDVEKFAKAFREDPGKVLADALMEPVGSELQMSAGSTDEKDIVNNNIDVKTDENTQTSENNRKEVESENLELGDIQLQENETTATKKPSTLLNDTSEKLDPTTPVEEVMCGVCGDTLLPAMDVSMFIKDEVESPELRTLSCLSGHKFCVDCWSSHLQVQVLENGSGCLPCPGYRCGESLNLKWAPILLKKQENVNRLLQQRINHAIDCSGWKQCPEPDCGMVVFIPSSEQDERDNSKSDGEEASKQGPLMSQAVTCGNGHSFCVSCTDVAHSPCSCTELPTWCRLVQAETKKMNLQSDKEGGMNSDDIANALWVAANTKRCPRCSTAIEKDEGCNHMCCRKCRKEFCWICMQDWSLHSDNTGGYFQCNRFTAEQPPAGGPEGEEGGASGALWAEEMGNAHAETLRMRERNRRMSRFIHHYTRFRAHGDSVGMEKQMRTAAESRILEGLKMAKRGEIQWLQGTNVTNPLDEQNPNSEENTDQTDNLIGLKNDGVKSAGGEGLDEEVKGWTDRTVKRYSARSEKCLSFLYEGFDELLKCRNILQWSYPYAFFEFDGEEDKTLRGFAARRNNRGLRARLGDHRSSFELLQADLEGAVETLSDVVARRRLRATKKQITFATRLARSKRVELESLLSAYAFMKQQDAVQQQQRQKNDFTAASERSNNTSNTINIFTRNRQLTSRQPYRPGIARNLGMGDSTRNIHTTSHRSQPGNHTIHRSDSDESIDLATLLYELELASQMMAFESTDNGINNANQGNNNTNHNTGNDNQEATHDAETKDSETNETNTPDNNNALTDNTLQSAFDILQNHLQQLFQAASGEANDNGSEATTTGPGSSQAGSTQVENPSSPHTPPRSGHTTTAGSRSGSSAASRRASAARRAQMVANEENELASNGMSLSQRLVLAQSRLSSPARPSPARRSFGSDPEDESLPSSDSDFDGEEGATLRLPAGNYDRMRLGRVGRSPSLPAPSSRASPMSTQQAAAEARLARLTRRAEEETALNRAILLSLRDPQPAEVGSGEASEEHIEMLLAMGFTRDQAIQGLRESRGNVELAANQLLGLDF